MELFEFFSDNKIDYFEPIKSFKNKRKLNPKVWKNFKLNKSIRKQLLKIGKDFYKYIEIDAKLLDIVLCGSMCNYNWSDKYSDFDVHLIINFSEINEDIELVKQFLEYAGKLWNENHDIRVKGYEVEVYVQDKEDLKESIKTGKMGGVFSLYKNKWIKKPKKINFKFDEKFIKEKAKIIIQKVNDIEEKIKNIEHIKPEESNLLIEKVNKIWEKIKNYRKSGLENEGGEYSLGNLIFKLLRRNGYIAKIMKIKRKIYDKQFF